MIPVSIHLSRHSCIVESAHFLSRRIVETMLDKLYFQTQAPGQLNLSSRSPLHAINASPTPQLNDNCQLEIGLVGIMLIVLYLTAPLSALPPPFSSLPLTPSLLTVFLLTSILSLLLPTMSGTQQTSNNNQPSVREISFSTRLANCSSAHSDDEAAR